MTPDSAALWNWFSLSYASFLTLSRALMHEMPVEWQDKMAALLSEYDATYPFIDNKGYLTHVTLRRDGLFVKTPDWIINYRHPDRAAIRRMTR